MPDKDNTPDDTDATDDATSTDSGTEGVVMDDAEAKAGFLEDRNPEEYPSVLRITSDSEQAGRAKRPFVPYDSIEVSLEISAPHPSDDAAPA